MTRILLVHPGATWSTNDVWWGLHDGLLNANVEVVDYAMDGRIANASSWLDWCYQNNTRKDRATPPNYADKLYLASSGIVEKSLMFGCDWILAVACGWLHPLALQMARTAGRRVALILTESPNQDDEQMAWANMVDVIWTNERSSVAKFAFWNEHTHYWQHAIDPARHHPGPANNTQPAHDVVFVGTGWQERIALLEAIDWTGIDLGIYGTWELMREDSPLSQYVRGGVTPNDITAQLYRNAKIGLNFHRTSDYYVQDSKPAAGGAESMNPRCYELAATGCFFVTDDRAEVRDVFGAVVPVFNDATDLQDMIRYYLAHDAARQAIAVQLPGLVAKHTFDRRAEEVLAVLDNYRG